MALEAKKSLATMEQIMNIVVLNIRLVIQNGILQHNIDMLSDTIKQLQVQKSNLETKTKAFE